MKEQLNAIASRLEAAGCPSGNMKDVKHWIASQFDLVQLHQLLDKDGRHLAFFITRLPAGRSARKFRTVCLTAPVPNMLSVASNVFSMGRRALVNGDATKPGHLAKAMEAEHGIQYAEFYGAPFDSGVDEFSYFVVGGKLLTAADHFLQKAGGRYAKYPDIHEVCELMDWKLKVIW